MPTSKNCHQDQVIYFTSILRTMPETRVELHKYQCLLFFKQSMTQLPPHSDIQADK